MLVAGTSGRGKGAKEESSNLKNKKGLENLMFHILTSINCDLVRKFTFSYLLIKGLLTQHINMYQHRGEAYVNWPRFWVTSPRICGQKSIIHHSSFYILLIFH